MSNFALRLPDHIIEQAKEASAEDKIPINQLLATLIAEGLGHRRGVRMMRERAARANVEAALAILDALPADLPPDAGDELRK